MAFQSGKVFRSRISVLAASALAGLVLFAGAAHSEEPFFDELRFGGQVAIDKTYNNDEEGHFFEATAYFDPFDSRHAADWVETLTRPRVFVGAAVATAKETNMLHAGVAWTADLPGPVFAELGFGGMFHDGNLEYDGTAGPKLGCRTLFHEYAALGVEVTEHWRVLGKVEHSSHANLCGEPNNGLSRAGLHIGYKF